MIIGVPDPPPPYLCPIPLFTPLSLPLRILEEAGQVWAEEARGGGPGGKAGPGLSPEGYSCSLTSQRRVLHQQRAGDWVVPEQVYPGGQGGAPGGVPRPGYTPQGTPGSVTAPH